MVVMTPGDRAERHCGGRVSVRLSSPALARFAEEHDSRLGVKDAVAGAVVAVVFVAMLAATWQRWTHPIIDHGREMNVPARILAGDRLYVDVFLHYGPFAPYFNALLYTLFGINLSTLHGSGIVCAAVIVALIYWLARQLLDPWESGITASLVVVTCAFAPYLGNYVQPYAYAALYGWVFALAALASLVRFATVDSYRWLGWASVFVGGTMACKPDFGLLGLVPAAVLLLVDGLRKRRVDWKALRLLTIPAFVIVVAAYAPFDWRTLVDETYRSFTPPQMMYFVHWLDGTHDWPYTGWAVVASVGMMLLGSGAIALGGLLFDPDVSRLWPRELGRIAGCLVLGWVLFSFPPRGPLRVDVNPLRSAPFVLVALVIGLLWHAWRDGDVDRRGRPNTIVLGMVAVFALVSIDRVLFNVSLKTPYTIFTVPVVMLIYVYLFQRIGPQALLASAASRVYARRAAAILLTGCVVVLGAYGAVYARIGSFAEISTPRGRLLTTSWLAEPFTQAIRFVGENTRPGEDLVAIPQATMIHFLSDRPNPLRDETFVPGFLTPEREAATVGRIDERRVHVILVTNWPTEEYRDRVFGVDYGVDLMRWVETRYHEVAAFKGEQPVLLGGEPFSIRAYVRNP